MVGLAKSELALKSGLNMPSEYDPSPIDVEGQSAPACSHHWVIEPANGSVSQGVCQICQEAREFKNSIEWEYWQRKSGKTASSLSSGKEDAVVKSNKGKYNSN